MYLWSEDVAARGSDERGSCLLQFLSQPNLPKKVYAFSDNCAGQNKNWAIMYLWLDQIRREKFEEIFHVFQ